MANPVLIAKLALVAADPKTWQKIIIACISIFIISAALLGSCGAMTFTDLGFDCSQLFSAKLNEYSAVFDSGARINESCCSRKTFHRPHFSVRYNAGQ